MTDIRHPQVNFGGNPLIHWIFQKKVIISGDEINKEDTVKLLEQLAGEEDEDGFIPYAPFVDKLCGKAVA